MARKSNKTAHVLNLLAGHDTKKEEPDTTADTSENSIAAPGEEPSPSSDTSENAVPADTPKETSEPANGNLSDINTETTGNTSGANTETAGNPSVSVIDHAEPDPLAELIHDKLLDELNAELNENGMAEADISTGSSDLLNTELNENGMAEADISTSSSDLLNAELNENGMAEADISTSSSDKLNAELNENGMAEADTTSAEEIQQPAEMTALSNTSEVENVTAVATPETVNPSTTPSADNGNAADSSVESANSAPQNTDIPSVAEEAPKPEPEFVLLNIMERIVRDKIIYFMRQFEVCTCDRCIEDTIALTLNGLRPKYIVTMPTAVDPLMSLYTNKYISDVTVEATKACMTIKENPRH